MIQPISSCQHHLHVRHPIFFPHRLQVRGPVSCAHGQLRLLSGVAGWWTNGGVGVGREESVDEVIGAAFWPRSGIPSGHTVDDAAKSTVQLRFYWDGQLLVAG